MVEPNNSPDNEADLDDRRKFLAACGKFAVVTPPTITMLLSTSLHSSAVAHSGRGGGDIAGSNGRGVGRFHPNNGGGNGGGDGSPNGHDDSDR